MSDSIDRTIPVRISKNTPAHKSVAWLKEGLDTTRTDHYDNRSDMSTTVAAIADETVGTVTIPSLGGVAPLSVEIVSGDDVLFAVELVGNTATLEIGDPAEIAAQNYDLTLRATYAQERYADFAVRVAVSA